MDLFFTLTGSVILRILKCSSAGVGIKNVGYHKSLCDIFQWDLACWSSKPWESSDERMSTLVESFIRIVCSLKLQLYIFNNWIILPL